MICGIVPSQSKLYLIIGGLLMNKTRTPEKEVVEYFSLHQQPMHKQYLSFAPSQIA